MRLTRSRSRCSTACCVDGSQYRIATVTTASMCRRREASSLAACLSVSFLIGERPPIFR